MSTGYLLDTNVVSETRKRAPDPHVLAWLDTVHGPSLYVSSMVLGEIRYGAERVRGRDPIHAEVIDTWLAGVYGAFGERIAPVTAGVAEEWGRLRAISPLPVVDALMAATAIVHGWTLVTRNVKDMERTGVHMVNPFEWPV